MLPSLSEWASEPYVLFVLLLSVRLAVVFLMTPVLFVTQVPPTVRVLLVLGLAATLALSNPAAAELRRGGVPADIAHLLIAVMTEAALGAVLALGIQLAFAAVAMAGTLIDVQMGFGMAAVVDPVTKRRMPIITTAFNQVAVLLFLVLNGHHALIRGIAYSLDRFPLGQAWAVEPVYGLLLKKIASVFGMGLSLAAPVACCLLFVEFSLCVVSRSLPQMNILSLGFSAKLIAGLVALAIWYGGAGAMMSRVYQSIFSTWDDMFSTSVQRSADGV